MVGATVINGLIHADAKLRGPREAVALLRVVLRINHVLMGPSLILLPISGIWLANIAGFDLWSGWLGTSFGLSLVLILAFVVGDRIERRLLSIAKKSVVQDDNTLPNAYRRTFLRAVPIGGGALVMSVAALILMIFKPY